MRIEQIGDCTLYLADCMDVFPKIQKCDVVWTDPPYNVGKDYISYKDNMEENDYFLWVEKWAKELKKLTNRISIYPPKKHLLKFWNIFPENHQVIIGWSPAGAIRSGFVHQYAPLLLSKPCKKMVPDHWWNIQIPGLGYFFREETYGHPGKTGEEITQKVIETISEKNEIVLDIFMGTGTTGVAAVKLGRKFIGIEREEQYFNIAVERIKQAYAQGSLFEEPKKQPEQVSLL